MLVSPRKGRGAWNSGPIRIAAVHNAREFRAPRQQVKTHFVRCTKYSLIGQILLRCRFGAARSIAISFKDLRPSLGGLQPSVEGCHGLGEIGRIVAVED